MVQNTMPAPVAGANDAADSVSDTARQALCQHALSEIAVIECAIAHLRMAGVDSEMGAAIAELQRSQTQLRASMRDAQHATHPKQLRSIMAAIDIAIRHSTETRQHAQAGQDASESAAKQAVRAAALPVAGMVSLRFLGKPLLTSDYRHALAMLQQRGQHFLQGMSDQFRTHADAALRHSVDIARSQQVQMELLQHAREAYRLDKPAEAVARLGEAAMLSLRDAERVHASGASPATDMLLQQAQHTAVAAVRHAADQAQLDARRECTEQGKTGAMLESCTGDGAVQRIDMLRVRMTRIQLYANTPEQEAEQRAERILQTVSSQEERQLQAKKEALGAGVMLRNIAVTPMDAVQMRVAPAETPGMAVAMPPIMNAY